MAYLCVGLPDPQVLAHIDKAGEDFILLGVDDRKGVDGDQDLISLTVNPYGVVEVLELVVGSELNIDVLGYAARDHALLVVLYFEKWSLRGQDVETLRGRRVVDQPHLEGVGL